MKIFAHTLVRNEERWVWFAVKSVIDHVDKMLLWDMESEDKTAEIIELLKKEYPKKISAKRINKVDSDGFAKVRQNMLDETDSDWFLVVDGDEIWWDDSITRVIKNIKNMETNLAKESIVVPMVNLVGDIFHYQDNSAGRYRLAGKVGHYALRGINRQIPGLNSDRPHGTWGWTDNENKMIQDRNNNKILFIDAPYMHATNLPRAGSRSFDEKVIKRAKKLKYELGISFPLDFYYPEVFFLNRPDIVPTPWVNMDNSFYMRAALETPLRIFKRKIAKWKVGY